MASRNNKRQPYKVRPNRNALCPCGSGRSYKNCCAQKVKASAGSTGAQPQKRRVSPLMIGLGVVVLVAVLFAIFRPWESDEVAAPQAWEYDAVTNQYWDPGHNHWHDGRPPSESPGAASSQGLQLPQRPPLPQPQATEPAGTQPEPWEYDAENDRYWHFDHWHAGPPPPPHLR